MQRGQHNAIPAWLGRGLLAMLAALLEATEQISRASEDLSQAVARLHASGVPGPDLEPTARYYARVIRRVEEAAELVSRRLR